MAASVENLTYTYALAAKLFAEHGLTEQGWKFDFSTSSRRIAVCKYQRRLIEFSLHRLGSDREVIKDIILHEIAHALVGPKHGHDYVWRSKCREIGAKPNRLSSETVTSKGYNFEIVCSNCDKVVGRRYRVKQALLDRYTSKCCSARLTAYDIREG
jgi:predicted SprT family Zn-dependent metalloprotease